LRRSRKPIRPCHSCPMNMGSHCWAYANPRTRWEKHGKCIAFENEEIYAIFEKWKKQPQVKTRRQIRREFYQKQKRHLPQPQMESGA
jgi:hypothetical protein